jgi:L-lactate dehydrogenase (cytochrome)/(S)-mandelate dehydrogenase
MMMRRSWKTTCVSNAAMRLEAQRTLPKAIFDFADGGAEDEATLRRNEAAFAQYEFLPKPLNGSPARDLSVELFGHTLSLPVMIGPTGLSGLFTPDGERAAARAAAAAGTGFCLSHASTCTLEEFAKASAPPRWMQVFIYHDRGFTREFVMRAMAAGYDGLVLTIDNQLLGNRERDIRNGFTIPPQFRPADVLAAAGKLPWLMRMRRDLTRVTFANYARPGETADLKALAGKMSSLLDPSLSWRDVDWIRDLWKGPFLLKGIMHPDEAREAQMRGIDGLIVSNHGGRQLDGVPATLDVLPLIVEAVDGKVPLLLDGGVRRGSDVVKALALGAKACLIGRPQLWGLAVGGEEGVTRVLDIFRREIDRVMGLLGVTRLDQLGPDIFFRPTRDHTSR